MNPFNYRLVSKMRGILMFSLLLLAITSLAQAPQSFKYQAVVRNTIGEPLGLTDVSIRISILMDHTEGTQVYQEVHNLTTSSGGVISLDIGSSTLNVGEFSEILWGLADYFVKVEVDPNGGDSFVVMGTTQLLSVPYAIYAKETGGPSSYTWDELMNYIENRSLGSPTPGMMVFVRDENKMVYFDGEGWVTTAGECFPQPSQADAGADQIDVEGTITNLAAVNPKHGVGVWSIVSEEYGEIISISDLNDPQALLTTTGGYFELEWTVSNLCGETSDQVFVSFCPENTLAITGEDQFGIPGNSLQLAGNAPGVGNTGTWTVTTGDGGSFANENDPLTIFTGVPGNNYTLRWTMATGCASNFAEMQIGFCYTQTTADAGVDQINVNDVTTILQGNEPGSGNTGLWTIISGEGGEISNPNLHNSIFNGLPDVSYVLRWTLTSDCDESLDEVTISFCPVLTIANAGPDQTDLDSTSVQLAANVPGTSNSGSWAIESMMGPLTIDESFDNPTDPLTIFNGNPGVTYVLSWTISTDCDESIDYVTVSFCPVLDTADAGPDNLSACLPHVLSANEPGAGNTGEWTIVSGTGGSLSNVNSATSTFSGTPGNTYELAWTISNACGSSTDNVIISFQLFPAIAEAGPDQLNVEGNSVTLAANTCNTGGIGQWSVVTGEGGSFDDIYNPTTTFTGIPNGEVYQLKWTISTSCYTSEDTVNVSFIAVFICGDDFVDTRDGKVYPTVQIGEQCWMAANLNFGNQVFSTPSDNDVVEKYCYSHDPANCVSYGGLYTWNEMMSYQTVEGGQGICPEGWSVPTLNDQETLIATLGGNYEAGGKMKETGDDYWENNVGATNESGFTSRGGGFHTGGFFNQFKLDGNFWSSSTDSGQGFALVNKNSSVYGWTSKYPFTYSQSVRCIKY